MKWAPFCAFLGHSPLAFMPLLLKRTQKSACSLRIFKASVPGQSSTQHSDLVRYLSTCFWALDEMGTCFENANPFLRLFGPFPACVYAIAAEAYSKICLFASHFQSSSLFQAKAALSTQT
jgi:hypothetical protein